MNVTIKVGLFLYSSKKHNNTLVKGIVIASHNISTVVSDKMFDSIGLNDVTTVVKPRMQRSGQSSVLRYAQISYLVTT
jgi:hypothetical protein